MSFEWIWSSSRSYCHLRAAWGPSQLEIIDHSYGIVTAIVGPHKSGYCFQTDTVSINSWMQSLGRKLSGETHTWCRAALR